MTDIIGVKLKNTFPDYGEPNIRLYLILKVLMSGWFQVGNWLLYVLLYMNVGTFAVYEAIAFGAGILVEIPSGAFADLFGRKRTVIYGFFLQAFGSILFTLGFLNNWLFFAGNLLIIVAFAFISGSLEALVYDTLKEKNKTEVFDDVIGKAKSLNIITIVIASLIGGLAWRYSIYLPWALSSLSFIIGFFVAFRLKEPKLEPERFTLRSFLIQNKQGFHYLFKSEFRKYTFSFAMIAGSFLMWHTGIVRVLMGRDFGYNGESLNYLIAGVSVFGFVASYFFGRFRKRVGDLWGYTCLLLISSMAWIVSGWFTGNVLIGFLVFSSITIAGTLAEIWSSIILNKHVHSSHRATAISTLSFVVQLPYVLVVVLFGQLIEGGDASLFYFITGALLLAGSVSYFVAERTNIQLRR